MPLINPGLPGSLWSVLNGGLWHATDIQGLTGILATACIHVSESNRYTNSFCRCRGCVSLFDLGPYASDQSEREFSNWVGWFGNQLTGRCTVWLQINRERSGDRLMNPQAVREAWAGTHTTFFPGVEACHKGSIPSNAIIGPTFIDRHDLALFMTCRGAPERWLSDADDFVRSLPDPPPENDLARALREYREKNVETEKQ